MQTKNIEIVNSSKMIAKAWLDRFQERMTTRFTLSGDKWTIRHTKLFFRTAFKYNYVGIQYINDDVGYFIGYVAGQKYDWLGRVKSGKLISVNSVTGSDEIKEYEITPDNTVVFSFGEFKEDITPETIARSSFKNMVEQIALEFMTLISNSSPKILYKVENQQVISKTVKATLDPQSKAVPITQTDDDTNTGIDKVEATTSINDKIAKLDLAGKLGEFSSSIDQAFNFIDRLLGLRHNTVFKRERVNTSEVENSTLGVYASELKQNDNLTLFVDDVKEKLGKEITFEDRIQSYLTDTTGIESDKENYSNESKDSKVEIMKEQE